MYHFLFLQMPNLQTTSFDPPLEPEHISGDNPNGTVATTTSLHINPSPRITELEQQLSAVFDSKQQLQNELNTVLDQQHQSQHEILQIRKNQDNSIEIAKREVANSYVSQIANLQHSLMQSESAHQELERKLADISSSHSLEVENILKKQEEIQATLLAEKDQKHAEHVARLTDKFTSQMEDNEGPKDIDEQEAERLKMIKTKMLEMFAAEKNQMLVEHQQEKTTMQQSTQKQLEDYRCQTEQLANTKLQEVHAQFMSAHQALLEQKNESDALAQELSFKLNQSQIDHSNLRQAKDEIQARYDQLSESHLDELEKARHDSNSFENRLNDWKEKASKLEAILHKSESESQSDLDSLREQNEATLSKIREDYGERLRSLQQMADDYHRKFLQAETEKSVTVENITKSHQEQLEQLKQDYSVEVDTLNQSIRESNAERGSLEAAEEHMSGLQKQLENYRKQEISFQNQLDEKERQYRDGIELYRQQIEREKSHQVEQATARLDSHIKSLEEELASFTASVESGDTERRRHEKIELLKVRHKKRISELETIHEKALKNLHEQLENSHSNEIESLTLNHTQEMSKLREEWTKKLEAEKAQQLLEIEAIKQAEIQQLMDEYKVLIEKATKSDADDISTKSNERIIQLESKMTALKDECSKLEAMRKDLLSQLELAQRQIRDSNQILQRTNTEMERLSQDCDRYQNKSKSLEVDLSISQSSHEQDKLRLSALQQELDEVGAKTEALETELGEVRQSQIASTGNEELLARLTNDLACKNVAIADLQAQNDSLNTEVFSLTQKCQKLVEKSHSVQEQLETSWGANEEIESLKQQIAELVPFKDEAAGLKEKIEMLEDTFKSKDEAVMSLQAQLEQATQYVTDSNTRRMQLDQTIAETAKEMDTLQQKVAMKEGQEKEIQRMIAEFELKLETLSTKLQEKEELVAEQTTTIQSLQSMKEGQEKEIQRMIAEFELKLETLSTKLQEKEELVAEQTTTIQSLQSQLGQTVDKVNEFQEQNTRLEGELNDTQEVLRTASEDKHKERYEQLREDFEKVCQEKAHQAAEVSTANEKVAFLDQQNTSWQEKVEQLEKNVQELQTQLTDKESELSVSYSEFTQKLKESELREKSLRNSQNLTPSKGNVGKDRSSLEETLTKAKQALTDKLAERSTLEKELSLHRTELERRLSEKQRLEEVLVEKSRFEQELQNQKEQLKNELETIESKMKLKEAEYSEDKGGKVKARGPKKKTARHKK